ncbi:hypothetical protein cypCar_00024373 [Cyprinus carpio]|nr:hypothetical protein cypCar_00024373 [Cyprinus carpio]
MQHTVIWRDTEETVDKGIVVQDILDHEREFVKELQMVLGCYLRPLQTSDKLSSADCSSLNGNLEDILSFQQGLCLALEECSNILSQKNIHKWNMLLRTALHGSTTRAYMSTVARYQEFKSPNQGFAVT